jgi:hypothetical protein
MNDLHIATAKLKTSPANQWLFRGEQYIHAEPTREKDTHMKHSLAHHTVARPGVSKEHEELSSTHGLT